MDMFSIAISIEEHLFGRASIREYRRKRPTCDTAAEIGVFKGINSAIIARKLKPKTFFCVDPYDVYNECQDINQIQEIERCAHRRLAHRHVNWVKSSDRSVVANTIGEVDYLYIDGDHSYKAVLDDLNAFWGSVKENGMIAGHDICKPEVFRAVAEFFVPHHIDVAARGTDWWAWKQ